MIIFESDSEEVRKSKRGENAKEGTKTYQRRAQEPPSPLYQEQQKRGIERARVQLRASMYNIGDTQYTNGLIRIRYKNGHSKYEYHVGFAGPARKESQMNSGVTTLI